MSMPYFKGDDGHLHYKPAEVDKELANFTALITTDVVLDNGVDTTRAYEIEATHRGCTYRFTVPAERFSSMNWVFEKLGASAIVFPGTSTKEHCRVAIQLLSGDIPTRREYTHTGWTEIDGKPKFLSRSGAIGADGLDSSVVVSLPGSLGRYDLGVPPHPEELAKAIAASMHMLDVATIEVTAPIFAAIWRAPLGEIDFSLHLVAQTGSGKSELSGLASQHFGAGLDARHLAASWSSTANANEALGFAAANVVLAIDDFAPSGSQTDIARQHRDADRLLRGAGNNAGRMRMRSDTSLREARPVRGLILSSGEDTPRGESLRARLLVIEMDQNEMRWQVLTDCQLDAMAGRYAAAMAGYVQWLAGHPEQFARFQQLRAFYRSQATEMGDHKRTPAIVADLAAAARIFCDFAVSSCALTKSESDDLWQRLWDALRATADRQKIHQRQSEPTLQFREYLGSAIRSGRAHLTQLDGTPPSDAIHFGWRTTGAGNERFEPKGDCIGWISEGAIFLDPKSAYAVAQGVAQRSGESLSVSLQRLKKSLNEKGLLRSVDQSRETLAVRRRIGGRNVAVLHVSSTFIDADPPSTEEPDKPDNDPLGVRLYHRERASMSGSSSGLSNGQPGPDDGDSDKSHVITENSRGGLANVGFVGFSAQAERGAAVDGVHLPWGQHQPDKFASIVAQKTDNNKGGWTV